jgi:hypothetical protein
MEEMLEDPDVVEQVAAAPQLGSVLRPLCQMLHVKAPPYLRLPRKPRRRVKKPIEPAPDWMVNQPDVVVKPDGTVWMHLGASTKWKPDGSGIGRTLEEARKFDPPMRIWPPWVWKS